MLGNILKYDLPTIYDPEGCPVTITIKPEILSSFVSLKENKIVIAPSRPIQVGNYEI